MSDRVHSGPGTCVAEVGEEAGLTGELRAALEALGQHRHAMAGRVLCGAFGDHAHELVQTQPPRIRIELPRAELDRLQRIHYRRRRPGARAPTSFAVYLPEGVVEFRATSQEAS